APPPPTPEEYEALLSEIAASLRSDEEAVYLAHERLSEEGRRAERARVERLGEEFGAEREGGSDEVPCPICRGATLGTARDGAILCPSRGCLALRCSPDGLSLPSLREGLAATMEEHAIACGGELGFGMREGFLVAGCRACGGEFVIL
ncbi:hypothetical protein TeGR_g11198, partial [Tetraparma gracilis]